MRTIIKNALKGLCIAVIGASLVSVTVLTGCKGETTTITKTTTATQTVVADGIPVISTDALAEQYDNPDWIIVDTRSQSSYNGWQFFGEERGGHIEGAALFPAKWIEGVKDADLQVNLDEQGITSDKTIVVYNTDARASEDMAAKLKDLGYSKLHVYNDILEWAADETLPMQKLVHYEKLVDADWVNDLIQGNNPPTYNGNDYRIIEVSWGAPTAYNEGHIPGSVHLDTDEIESLPLWNFLSDEELETVFLDLGITKDTLVITYGTARFAMALMMAGVEDVRLLDGGLNAWTAAGYELETETNERVPVNDFGVDIPVHPEYVISTAQLKGFLEQPDFVLTSIRRWEEFIGEISGYSYIEPKGEIQGAVWGHNTRDFRDQDGRMINYHQIEAMWAEWGITPDKTASFY